ncbi:hypothetical protein [Pseudoduganella chitinolytica]|uniref:Uncharacterized protein n=1 Tax=Pseudoduganella chitinolytica TaxID=34070 RepID=A0ABY8BJA2_9BURK|nr:hypothetical protein [Pseudoduganella chitinolytica]WEF35038.1 hypothetical protein PX653_09830 [Pseudoduganella chitinolytica]
MKDPKSYSPHWSQLKRNISASFFLVSFIVLIYHGIADKKPPSNTPAYLIAHGIYVGQVNEIKIQDSLLRFPVTYLPNPHTTGKITRGQADYVSINIDLGPPFDHHDVKPQPFDSPVSVVIHAYGIENVQREWSDINEPSWRVEELTAIGLRQYTSPQNDGGWGYRLYVPIDPKATTPKGGPIVFTCAGSARGEPNRCRLRYQHPQGVLVEYYLSGTLLSNWQQVHSRVLEVVNSFFVD